MTSNRRQFLKTAGFATALSQGRIQGANDRVQIGAIGTGGRSQDLLGLLNQLGGNDVVAVCDVYEPARNQARQKYGPHAREYEDYRQLLDQKDIDAVVIASPDHWHVPMTADAVRAGKDVYVEKPVTHTLEEGDVLQKAVDGSQQIVQTGTQQRSWPHFQQAREVVQSGALGKITLIQTYWYQNYLQPDEGEPPRAALDPSKLNWKLWLGSAPEMPFSERRFSTWRWFWDYGGGALTDLFTHWVDVAHWYMGSDAPRVCQALGERYVLPDLECPDTLDAAYHYPGNFTVTYTGSMIGYLQGGGLWFRGAKGMLKLNRGGFRLYPEWRKYSEHEDYPKPLQEVRAEDDGTKNHLENFLDCIKSRKVPNAPVTAGIAAARAGHLGNLAIRRGQTIRYPL